MLFSCLDDGWTIFLIVCTLLYNHFHKIYDEKLKVFIRDYTVPFLFCHNKGVFVYSSHNWMALFMQKRKIIIFWMKKKKKGKKRENAEMEEEKKKKILSYLNKIISLDLLYGDFSLKFMYEIM